MMVHHALQAIGDSGIDQTVQFKAAVCTVPFKSTRRSLQLSTFLWKGGGGCRGCPCDCKDGRRELQYSVWGTALNGSIRYMLNQLESSVLNAILNNSCKPNHIKCLGSKTHCDCRGEQSSIDRIEI